MFKEIKRQITLFNTLILIAFLFIFIFLLGFLVQWSLGLSGEVYLQKIAEEIENREQNGAIKEESSASTAVHEKLGYDYIIWDSEHNVSDMKVENNSLIMHGYEMDLDAGNNG
ncbi:MAG: sensor histidine kinase, partial [Eubacterium sp.]